MSPAEVVRYAKEKGLRAIAITDHDTTEGIQEGIYEGTRLNVKVIPGNFEPWVIFILPPGGFLTLGFWLLLLNWFQERRAERAKVREWPEGVAEGRAA